MSTQDSTIRKAARLEKRFISLATEVGNYFPDLDLRFNLRSGSKTAHCFAPEFSEIPIELSLITSNTTKVIREAVWAIKQLTHRYDA